MNTAAELDDPFVPSVVAAVRAVVANRGTNVSLHEPEFKGREWQYLKECLDTGWVSSLGEFVDRFERMLEDCTGARHAVATVNGTALRTSWMPSRARSGSIQSSSMRT